MTRPATIHVIDDDEALRDSLRWLLEGHGFDVVCHADAQGFLATGAPEGASVVLLDVRMPGLSGMQLQDRLSQAGFAAPLIFITGHGDVPMAVEAVKKGAFDFLEKPFNEAQLLSVIRAALEQPLSPTRRENQDTHRSQRLASLTPREREVLDRVVAGKLNKTIADELGISIKTVETHRARMMEKMQAKSLADLIQGMLGPA
jgi:FixJ family two-component response regulator